MELMEQMPKVETAEFDPIGLFFLLVAVVPVVHWLWNYFSKSVDIEEWASSRGLGFVEYDREFGRELSRLLSLPGQDHVARDVIAVRAREGEEADLRAIPLADSPAVFLHRAGRAVGFSAR